MKFIKWKHVGVFVFLAWATYVTMMLPAPFRQAEAAPFVLRASASGGVDIDYNNGSTGSVTSPSNFKDNCDQFYDASNKNSKCNADDLADNDYQYIGINYQATCPNDQVMVGIANGVYWGNRIVNVPICAPIKAR